MQQALSGSGGGATTARTTLTRLTKEKARLTRTLEVNEARVSEADRVNRELMAIINKLRKGRADFLRSMRSANERETSMINDMKHFGQSAHASLDEKEKFEARLRRSQFDHGYELRDYEKKLAALDEQIEELDASIQRGQDADEHDREVEKRAEFRALKQKRDIVQKRETNLAYLKNQVQGMEAEFARLLYAVGLDSDPNNPCSNEAVHQLISASLKNDERNTSLLSFVEMQEAQAQVLEADIANYEEQFAELMRIREAESNSSAKSSVLQARVAGQIDGIAASIETHDALLSALCKPVQLIFDHLGCVAPADDGGLFNLKGCRADTLTDYIRVIDEAVQQRHQVAQQLLTNAIETAENENGSDEEKESKPKSTTFKVLEQFACAAELRDHPSVQQVRKELEQAALERQLGA